MEEVLFNFGVQTFLSTSGLAIFVYLLVQVGVKPLLLAVGIDPEEDKTHPVYVLLGAIIIGLLASVSGVVIAQVDMTLPAILLAAWRGVLAALLAAGGREVIKAGQSWIGGNSE